MLKSLSDTSVFKYSELMGSDKLTNIIKNIVTERSGTIYVTENQLEDVFYKMRHKSFNFSAKFAVLDLFKKGIIRIIYNERVKLTVAVPFIKYKMPTGGFGVIVNISNFSTMKPDGTVNIDPLVLYTLMLSAAYSLVIDKNIGTMTNYGIPDLYSSLFANIISRISNIDQARREMIKFISTKFIYVQLGSNEHSASIASSRSIKLLDKASIEQVDLSIPAKAYNNLESLLSAIKEAFPEFNTLSMGIFFDRYMRTYGEITAFASEYVPFFVTMFVAMVANCNNLVNIKNIEREANRHSKDLIMCFNKIENAVISMTK